MGEAGDAYGERDGDEAADGSDGAGMTVGVCVGIIATGNVSCGIAVAVGANAITDEADAADPGMSVAVLWPEHPPAAASATTARLANDVDRIP